MSRLPFELLLAFRYLRPKRTYVSIITLISIIGVMLGVAVLIIVISVMSGFDQQLREKILGFNAHLKVFRDTPMRDYREAMRIVSANHLVRGVAPFVIGPVLAETEPEDSQTSSNRESPQVLAPFIRGIDPGRESSVSILPSSIKEGRFDVSGNGVLIGSELAQAMGLDVGDKLAIYSPRSFQEMREGQKHHEEVFSLPDDFVVKGIFDVGYYDYDANVVVCSLANAQDLYDLNDSVHGLLVMLHDPFQADEARTQLRQSLGPGFVIRTWMEDNSGILNALIVEKNVMFYLLFFIVVVAAFGITSALITFVVQKTREIGMLKALGATSGQVMWLFLSQSVLVGVLGGVRALGLGMLALAYRNEFLHFMNRLTGLELFPASIYSFNLLPAVIAPGDIAIICGGSLVVCLLAGLLPAWNAGRLKPVEALRHE
ncbi:MAG: ABC transporter permease [Candidatus Omnitrophica bacterium]|nr:ABC transporter permease [Candidatus Omnitrophota bacterium]